MKTIFKNLSILCFFLFASIEVDAQAVTSEPNPYDDPTVEVKLIVDLNLLDQTLGHTQLLVEAATNGEDMYIWTWSPFSFLQAAQKQTARSSTLEE
ncbi:MAG: hypothetical protein R2850_05320 [Bacteroidia bacterium]